MIFLDSVNVKLKKRTCVFLDYATENPKYSMWWYRSKALSKQLNRKKETCVWYFRPRLVHRVYVLKTINSDIWLLKTGKLAITRYHKKTIVFSWRQTRCVLKNDFTFYLHYRIQHNLDSLRFLKYESVFKILYSYNLVFKNPNNCVHSK